MKKGKVCGLVAGFVLYSAALAGIFYFAGSRSVSDTAGEYPDIQTFYAQVTDISDYRIRAEGLAVNDINFRGAFEFSAEDAKIIWHYTDISIEDIDVGDNIAVSFFGEVMESYPAKLTQVTQLTLLDDEK